MVVATLEATKATSNSRSNMGKDHNSSQFSFSNLEGFGAAVVLKDNACVGEFLNAGRQGRCHEDRKSVADQHGKY